MFACRSLRLPLRRCLHSQAGPTPRAWVSTRTIVLGASVASASYFAWRMSSRNNHIRLDDPRTSKPLLDPAAAVTVNQEPIPELGSAPANLPNDALDAVPSVKVDPPSLPESDASAVPAEPTSDASQSETETAPQAGEDTAPAAEGSEAPSAEGDSGANQGAYNPETGEINWDCPCLGGMAHGPCGQQFREAFSCFVYSEEEPKGINCVEKFQAMQNCFREHPDVYGEELDDDEKSMASEPEPASEPQKPEPEKPRNRIRNIHTD